MPSPKVVPVKECRSHLAEAHILYERYQRFVSAGEGSPDFDWAVVALFYSALHLVQAHAISKAKITGTVKVPENHRERDDYVTDHIKSIEYAYSMLKNASEDARYDLVKENKAYITNLHDTCYTKIKNHLASSGFVWQAP